VWLKEFVGSGCFWKLIDMLYRLPKPYMSTICATLPFLLHLQPMFYLSFCHQIWKAFFLTRDSKRYTWYSAPSVICYLVPII
jgi:hypothetical protein